MSGRSERDDGDRALVSLYSSVLDLLVSGAPQPGVLETITGALEQLIPGSLAAVLLLDREAGVLRVGAGQSLPTQWVDFIDPWPVAPGVGSCGDAAHTMRRVVTADVTTDPRWDGFRDLGIACGLRACWSTPIVDGQGDLLGTFAIYHDAPHSPTAQELDLVDRCTHLAAIAVEHAAAQAQRNRAIEAEVAQRTAESANGPSPSSCPP